MISEGHPKENAAIYDDYNDGDSDSPGQQEQQLYADTGPLLVVHRSCLSPPIPLKPWQRTKLFHTSCTINGKICKLIIDSGSCANFISQEAFQKLGLHGERHPTPYKLA